MRYNKNQDCEYNRPKQCGCNKPSNCEYDSPIDNCEKCYKYKYIAQEKCEQAEIVSNNAQKAAQEAKEAEERAEYYQRLAFEESLKANKCWECYKKLSNESIELMKEAQVCLSKAEQCFRNCYLSDVGPVPGNSCKPNCNHKHSCKNKSNNTCIYYLKW